MSYNKPIHRIAIVGTGVIGASWAAQYLARGFDVVATDPAPNAEANLRKYVDEAWPDLTNIGLSKGASRDRLSFTTNMKAALSQADLVQENGPERRWGVMGQSLQWHVGGGAGGIKHFMEHLMDPLQGMMKALGTPNITPELKQTVIDGVAREASGRSVDQLAQDENRVIVGLLKLRGLDPKAAAVKSDEPKAATQRAMVGANA